MLNYVESNYIRILGIIILMVAGLTIKRKYWWWVSIDDQIPPLNFVLFLIGMILIAFGGDIQRFFHLR